MKMAKSYKFLILFATMVLSFVLATGLLFAKNVMAEEAAPNTVNYVTLYSSDAEDATKLNGQPVYDNGSIKVTASTGNALKFNNKLVLEQGDNGGELGIELNIPDGKKLTVKLTATALDLNGNYKLEGEQEIFDKEIVSAFEITGTGVATEYIFGISDNRITLNGAKVSEDNYYLLDVVDDRVVVSVCLVAEEEFEYNILSVDQKAQDTSENYKQTFELNADNKLTKVAYPRAVLEKSTYAKTSDGYVLNKIDGEGYTIKFQQYSLVSSSTGFLSADKEELSGGADDGIDTNNRVTFPVASKNFIYFHMSEEEVEIGQPVDASFDISWNKTSDETVKIETFDVKIITQELNQAPYYDNSLEVLYQLKSYQRALENATKPNGVSIVLGKTFNLPSVTNFILDDTLYPTDANFTKTYNYVTPSNASKTTTSSTSIKIDEAGTYKVYATAAEKSLKLESDLFYDVKQDEYYVKTDDGFEQIKKQDALDENWVRIDNILNNGNPDNEFFIYMFTFEIEDEAMPSIVSKTQENGYKGVLYKASPFTMEDAAGYSPTYKLYYNSNVDASENSDGWVEIIAVKYADENGANGYTLDQLTAIGYDGKLSFTPDKVGAYKIECEITSNNTYKVDSEAVVIKVIEPAVVEPANYWFEDNLASIIFLSVGTACLIAVIVLLLVKPKERKEIDE